MNNPMPLLLVAALCALAPSVTLKARAQPLARLLPALSEKVGRTLGVQPALAREQLVIDATNVDPEALLARIAEVTHAQWVEEAGEYRLRRTSEGEKALERGERAFHGENFRRQWTEATKAAYDVQKVARAALEELRTREVMPPEGERPTSESLPPAPAERYLSELLLGLPSDALAGLEDGRGIVYSNRPLGSQRPLPASLNPIVARLFRDHRAFTAVLAPHAEEEYPDAPPARVVLSVQAVRLHPGSLRLIAQLILRDRDNGPLATALLNTYSPDQTSPRTPEEPRVPPVPLNPVAEEWESIRRGLRPHGGLRPAAPPISAGLRESVLNPERDGRLAQTWSDALFAFADREAMPLVANLLDIAEDIDAPETPENRVPRRFLEHLAGMETRREGGWITVRPRHPGSAGRFRADRGAAGGAIRAVADERAIPLEEAAAIQARLGRSGTVLTSRLPLIDRTGGAATHALNADEFGLAILDGLGPSGRSALYAGRSLPFASLPPVLQSTLREFYLNAGSFSFLVLPDREEVGDADGDNDRDATEVVGAAQVSGLALSASVEEKMAFLGVSDATPDLRQTLDVDFLLHYLDEELRPRKPEETEEAVVYNRFQRIGSRSITLKIHFPNGYRHEIYLDDFRVDPRAPFLSPAQFPEPVRAYLRKRRKEIGGEG